MEIQFNEKDDLLRGITFEDLIVAVQSNCKEINEHTIKETLNDMLEPNLQDMRFLLNQNMELIIRCAK